MQWPKANMKDKPVYFEGVRRENGPIKKIRSDLLLKLRLFLYKSSFRSRIVNLFVTLFFLFLNFYIKCKWDNQYLVGWNVGTIIHVVPSAKHLILNVSIPR